MPTAEERKMLRDCGITRKGAPIACAIRDALLDVSARFQINSVVDAWDVADMTARIAKDVAASAEARIRRPRATDTTTPGGKPPEAGKEGT